MGLGSISGVIAGGTSIVDRGLLWTAIVGIFEFSEEDLNFSERLEVRTVDAVSINFEFISEVGGAVAQLLFSDASRGESRTASVSEK